MFDLMIGIDGVQRRTRRSFEQGSSRSRKRHSAAWRTTVAAALRAAADRVEPAGVAAQAVGGEM